MSTTAPPRISGAARTSAVRLWIGAAASLLAISVAVLAWARTRPGFDPYGWLTWGRLTLHGGLDTNAAPSWKPLPYVFTVVYGLLGRTIEMWLWMVTVVAVSLAGVAFAARVASRLTAAAPERRWAGWVAGLVAALSLLGLRDESGYGYVHHVLSAQSDPMIVGLLLAAIDCGLSRRPRWAWCLGALAGLGRPEVWPFLLVDGAWLWRARPAARPLVLGAGAAIALLWFGVPALTSRSWFVAGDNAFGYAGAPHGDRLTAELHRFWLQNPWPLLVAAGVMALVAARRRERAVIVLAAAALAWLAIEIAFTLHGWPGLGRYLFEASALVCVLAGVFAGRTLAAADGWPLVGGGTIVVALALGATFVGGGELARARADHRDLVAQRARTRQIEALGAAIDRSGGAARVRACGEAVSDGLATQTVLAYLLSENVNRIGYRFPQRGHPSNPIVVFAPRAGGRGWRVLARRQATPACRALTRS